jgi:hypothetical protein
MIKGVSITNFKGIGDPGIKIDLEPVTLLFGNNSAGKSTIFHAFLYAYEVLVNRNLNADRTTLGGDNIDLGGFQSFIHDHNLENQVSIEIDLDLASAQLDKEWRVSEYLVATGANESYQDVDLSALGTDVWKASVKFNVAWNSARNRPFVNKLNISLDDDVLLRTWSEESSTEVNAWVNYRHRVFRWPRETSLDQQSSAGVLDVLYTPFRTVTDSWFWQDGEQVAEDLFDEKIQFSCGEPPKSFAESTPDLRVVIGNCLAGEVHWFYRYDYLLQKAILIGANFLGGENYSASTASEEWDKQLYLNQHDAMLPIKMLDQTDALPALDKPIQMNLSLGAFEHAEERDIVCDLMTRLAVGPLRLLARELKGFRHIGPLRSVPPRAFQRSLSIDASRWCSGLAAWDTLSVESDEFVGQVSNWLSSSDRLGTGYSLLRKQFKELDIDGYILRMLKQENPLDDLQIALDGLEKLPTMQRLSFRDDESQVMIEPPDIAVGITQLLPVVVAAVDKHPGITLIEQPELHNHPAVEVGLGDLFVETINQSHCRFILETHGEHLMLRMLRRIREKTEGTLPTGTKGLLPDELAVYYIERNADGVVAKRLHIDESGEFIDKWPRGFFRERSKELF